MKDADEADIPTTPSSATFLGITTPYQVEPQYYNQIPTPSQDVPSVLFAASHFAMAVAETGAQFLDSGQPNDTPFINIPTPSQHAGAFAAPITLQLYEPVYD